MLLLSFLLFLFLSEPLIHLIYSENLSVEMVFLVMFVRGSLIILVLLNQLMVECSHNEMTVA